MIHNSPQLFDLTLRWSGIIGFVTENFFPEEYVIVICTFGLNSFGGFACLRFTVGTVNIATWKSRIVALSNAFCKMEINLRTDAVL
jgi:hypothetical protein